MELVEQELAAQVPALDLSPELEPELELEAVLERRVVVECKPESRYPM